VKGHPRDAVVFDLHSDSLLRLDAGEDLAKGGTNGHFDLPRARKGGLGAIFLASWIDPRFLPAGAAARTLGLLAGARRFVEANAGKVGLALGAGDVVRLHREGRLAVLLSIEGGHAIENDAKLLETYAALGVRSMTLTWMNGNDWADASTDPVVHHGGLTAFGRRVVREMNRLGLVVDLAHVSRDTFYDALEESRVPVLVTHAGARALADHPRNVGDDQLRALASNGGAVGIAFYPGFLTGRHDDGARVDDVVAHIDHVVSVAGIDHVALGSDFDGITKTVAGLGDASRYPAVSEALRARGYGEGDIRKVLGENALRVLREAVGR